MTTRVIRVAVWIAASCTQIAALYWAFLNTPESNIVTLAASALLTLLMVILVAVVANVAVLLALGGTIRDSFGSAVLRIGWFIAAAATVLLLAWGITRGDGWIARHSGEISAWFIAQFGWADATPLFRAQSYLSVWLRWVVFPVAAIAALAAIFQRGAGTIMSSQWLRAAWHWRTLLAATAAFVVLIVLPWRAAFWRPSGLPPTWIEPALAALKLALVGSVMSIGLAVIVVAATRRIAAEATEVAEE